MRITAKEAIPLLIADGMTRTTLGAIDARLKALGYRRDAGSCDGDSEWITGPNAGIRYPNGDYSVTDRETGLSAFHYQGRRDSRFAELQEMRGTLFAYSRGRIRTI